MIAFDSDFECGNGRDFQQVGPQRYRLDVVGDKPVYNRYFCFDLWNEGQAEYAAIEVWPDPLLDDTAGFISHFPTTIWVAPAGLGRYLPLPQGQCETHPDHIAFSLDLAAGERVRVTDYWPSPYSETAAFLQRLAEERPDECELFSLGDSVQGRPILGVRTRPVEGQPRVLGLAGQHPSEYAGIWAMRGIADFSTSLIPEAVALRRSLCIEVVPAVNPDGNALGRNGFNAEGLDMYRAFGAHPGAFEPEAHESRLLWRWATQKPLALWMNMHCYMGWRRSSEYPFDGWYRVHDEVLADPQQRRLYRGLCDAVRLLTDAASTGGQPATHTADAMEYQLAERYGIPHVFYEINSGTAGPVQAAKRGLAVFRATAGVLVGS